MKTWELLQQEIKDSVATSSLEELQELLRTWRKEYKNSPQYKFWSKEDRESFYLGIILSTIENKERLCKNL